MRAQITLTVEAAKRIIAKGILQLPEVRKARAAGQIFLKGGTTVSAVCEALCGKPLGILGRISPQGARTARQPAGRFHCALFSDSGGLRNADDNLEQAVAALDKADVVVIGANAIDAAGHAAIMYGAELGGAPGRIISGLMSDFRHVFIAAGLEKLVPGDLMEAVRRTGRRSVDAAMGMAVGLTPLVGRLVTEIDALRLLAAVDCWVIGRGGIRGAEGATTLVVEGPETQVKKILRIVRSVEGAAVSGIRQTLEDCVPPQASCRRHLACVYKKRPRALPPGAGRLKTR
jgi:hypothetical protein